jgi:hypothetical protein
MSNGQGHWFRHELQPNCVGTKPWDEQVIPMKLGGTQKQVIHKGILSASHLRVLQEQACLG